MAKLSAVRLSNDPNTQVVACEDGLNGKASLTAMGKLFVELEFIDDKNIFENVLSIRRYYKHNDGWAGMAPDVLKSFEGKDVPGKFVTLKVNPYFDSGDVSHNTFTAFVMPHENPETVFASMGHQILSEDEKRHSELTEPNLIFERIEQLRYDYRNVIGEYMIEFERRYGENERLTVTKVLQQTPLERLLIVVNSDKYSIAPKSFTERVISNPYFLFSNPHSKCLASLQLLDIWNQTSNIENSFFDAKQLYQLSIGIIHECERDIKPLVQNSMFNP